MVGFIHSQESFGTVDGPGIRYVLFLQGCPMRCIYCHNPDTWETGKGKQMTPKQVIAEVLKNRDFYSKGGITVTGGEPLMQTEFVTELFSLAKEENIHTCIDTSGAVFNPNDHAKTDELMKYTDLVMLDIKHIDNKKHTELCRMGNKNILEFAKYLEKKNVPVWIRHIIVKGYTDDEAELLELGRFIGTLKNVKALDVIPYHTMGVTKYKELGIPYPLGDMPALDVSEAIKAKSYILKGIKEVRS